MKEGVAPSPLYQRVQSLFGIRYIRRNTLS